MTDLIDYKNIDNSPINVTHEASFLFTPYQLEKSLNQAREYGHSDSITRIETQVKSQIVKRKQVMHALHKEIEQLEELV